MVVTRSMCKRATALKSTSSKTLSSSGPDAQVQPVAGPSRPARKVKRERSGITFRDQTQIKDSRKRQLLRQIKSKAKGYMQGLWSTVVVGNIDTSFSEEIIRGIFQGCGQVEAINLRCIGTGPRLASEASWYATVRFATPTGALRALRKHNSTWLGKRIIVTGSVCNLPELSLRPSFETENRQPQRVPLQLQETLLVLPGGETVSKGEAKDKIGQLPMTRDERPWGWWSFRMTVA